MVGVAPVNKRKRAGRGRGSAPRPKFGSSRFARWSRSNISFAPGGFAGLMTNIHAGRLDAHLPDDSELSRAGALVAEYADLPLGLVDATVLAWVERRREPKLATLE